MIDKFCNIRDLMIPEDALEMENRYETVLREYNDQEEIGIGFRAARDKALFDWEVDLPDFF